MTVDGIRGTASRKFKVVSDGRLHVKITSPLKDSQPLDDGTLVATLTNEVASTLSAASTSDVQGGVTYYWTMTRIDADGVTRPFVTLSGQNVSFTPASFPCGSNRIRINVLAINRTGEQANDSTDAFVFRFCPPD